jgi:hypothetical protein
MNNLSEMLVLAAKAAHLRIHEVGESYLYIYVPSVMVDGQDAIEFWCPQDSATDAFNLQVYLGMSVNVLADQTIVELPQYDIRVVEHVRKKHAFEGEQDQYATTRLAILRAAAKVGERV